MKIKVADEATLENWTTEYLLDPSAEAEGILHDEQVEWIVQATLRYRMKENRKGQVLNLFLKVSIREGAYLRHP